MKYRRRSIRIGDDVWDALKASGLSANQVLKVALLPMPVENMAVGWMRAAATLKTGIEPLDTQDEPTTGAPDPDAPERPQPPVMPAWRADRGPLLRPSERKKK